MLFLFQILIINFGPTNFTINFVSNSFLNIFIYSSEQSLISQDKERKVSRSEARKSCNFDMIQILARFFSVVDDRCFFRDSVFFF